MPMSPSDRKAELIRRGHKLTTIANELGVSNAHVSMVLSGDRRSERIERAIAERIGKPVAKVFGPARGAAAA